MSEFPNVTVEVGIVARVTAPEHFLGPFQAGRASGQGVVKGSIDVFDGVEILRQCDCTRPELRVWATLVLRQFVEREKA